MVGDLGIGTWGLPVHDPREPFRLSWPEYFGLFGVVALETAVGPADSEEWLALISWLVERNTADHCPRCARRHRVKYYECEGGR